MKIGVLEFRYGAFEKFGTTFREQGRYSINIGDSIQSMAVKALLGRMGVAGAEIVSIDRDALPLYTGPAVKLIMNACFYEHSFPLPSQIEPVFIGFETSKPALIRAHLDYFKKHEPIGCRDNATCDLLKAHGVKAYTTGCLTMTFPLRHERPCDRRVLFIGGEKAGLLPPALKLTAPASILEASTYIHQRMMVGSFPLSDADLVLVEKTAERLLSVYRTEATLVVTPLLHAAGPCLAMGIPVILARRDQNSRFSAINSVVPVYTPGEFGAIDWDPPPIHIEALKDCLRALLGDLIEGREAGVAERLFLDKFYKVSEK